LRQQVVPAIQAPYRFGSNEELAMARWKWAGLMMLAGTIPAMAALPPHYQRQDELEAIIAHVIEEFGMANPIEFIVMQDTDFYKVISGNCHMEVVVVDVPAAPGAEPIAGPRQFAVESGPLVCE
jgi:hypothetical protein